MTMDRRSLLEMMGTAALGGVLVASGAVAQQKPIKDQLVGAWTLLLDDGVKPDGTQVPIFGPNAVGTLILTSNGRYSLQIMRVVNRAPFASNNRDSGTADENKSVAQGTLSTSAPTPSMRPARRSISVSRGVHSRTGRTPARNGWSPRSRTKC